MIRRNLRGPYAQGVVNPYTTHVHPYPTRFHGAIYTRPVFGMPYAQSPHAVFKPDDFYSYYGVSGLGAFGGSSLGNGTIGGNTLGLGATGTPIYWHSYNEKTKTLQGGLNKVLVSNAFHEITVDGKLGAETCAALGLCKTQFPSELASQVPDEIVAEATNICNQVMTSTPAVKTQIATYMTELVNTRAVVPPEPIVSPSEIVSPDTAPVITPAPLPELEASIPAIVQPVIEQPMPAPDLSVTTPMELPEMEVDAMVAAQSQSNTGLYVVLGVVALAGGAYVAKKKGWI